MSFSFKDLVLGNIDHTGGGSNILPAGVHLCRVTEASIQPKDGNFQAVIQLQEVGGSREIRAYLTLHHSSAKAVEIGMKQLKQLAVYGGHPDPDNAPSHGIGSFVGLVCGVGVKEEEWQGKPRHKVSYFCDKSEVPNVGAGAAADFDDDIPF